MNDSSLTFALTQASEMFMQTLHVATLTTWTKWM